MKKLPLGFALWILLCLFTSCDKDLTDDIQCTCGGSIGDWGEPVDTTTIHQGDTTGGFEVEVNPWGSITTHDIYL